MGKNQLSLDTSIRYVKGVGPKMAQYLAKLNIGTVEDLVHHYPFRHQDYSDVKNISQINPGETVTLIGQIQAITSNYTRSARQKTIQKATFKDTTGELQLLWFNMPFLKKALRPPILIAISGKVKANGNQLQLVHPDYEILAKGEKAKELELEDPDTINTGRLVPVYSTTAGISNKYLRKIIHRVLPQITPQLKEFLPDKLRKKHNLISYTQAVEKIHFPNDQKELGLARKRLGFNEMFLLQLNQLQQKKSWQQKHQSPQIAKDQPRLSKFINQLPFELTSAQQQATSEILKDMDKNQAMNRLLQGDVGSGKTVVAAAAILTTAQNNYQSLFMAPTEILAQQHFKNLSQLLEPFDINPVLLTSSSKTKQEKIKDSKLIIGTHALLHQEKFGQVGLVIIDEQHRFGVSQRAKLIKNRQEKYPHTLTMTATPIPRTISLTVYGDLDVSRLDEMPPGRKPVKTHLIPQNKRDDCYQWIRNQINKKNTQAFIICPLVEESETLDSIKSATEEYQYLKQEVFPKLKLGLVHGRMKADEKDQVLQEMNQGKIDILVATPVVEVGIDIPNTNIMIIESAQRFGLAQLHQLRGRIGRGETQAYCFLFADRLTKKAKKRLTAMEKNNDGLELAQIDLKMRGPGEIYGTKQHGFPDLKIASYTNLKLIQATRNDAQKILNQDPDLNQHAQLKRQLSKVHSQKPIAQN
jgi:ATP-dependent DNA helicase RecG